MTPPPTVGDYTPSGDGGTGSDLFAPPLSTTCLVFSRPNPTQRIRYSVLGRFRSGINRLPLTEESSTYLDDLYGSQR